MRRGILSFVAACVAVVSLLLSGCSDSGDVAVGYGIGPVEISVSSKGEIRVELGAKFATPIGTFSVKGGVTEGLEQKDDETVVLIRQTIKGQVQDTGFSLKTNQKLIVELNGQFYQEITDRRIVIKVKPGSGIKVRLESPATSSPSRSASPKPAYRLAYENKLLTVPSSRKDGEQGIDLDIPVVADTEDMDSSDTDLRWDSYEGLYGGSDIDFGSTTAGQPDPKQCAQHAKERAVGNIEGDELRNGLLFCVITDEQAIAWLQLRSVSGGDPDEASLAFRVTLWKLTTALIPPADYTGYDHLFTKVVSLPNPNNNGEQAADLDEPRAGDADDIESTVEDVGWDAYEGFYASGDKLMGTGPEKQPKPNTCAEYARERSAGTVAPEQLRVGQAFCVITDKGGVAWLKLTSKSRGDPNRARLTFSVTLWGQRL
jgi:hypothetical protein